MTTGSGSSSAAAPPTAPGRDPDHASTRHRRLPRHAAHRRDHPDRPRVRGPRGRSRPRGPRRAGERECRGLGARAVLHRLEHAGDGRAAVRLRRPCQPGLPPGDADDGHHRERDRADREGPGRRGARVPHQAVHARRAARQARAAGPAPGRCPRMTAPQTAQPTAGLPITALLDAETVLGIADQIWPSLVGDGEVFVPVPAPPPAETVSAWVDITGPWTGSVVLTCAPATAEALTASVLMTRPPVVVDADDVEDALGELANVLGGNIKSVLPGESRLGLPQIGSSPSQGRLDDVCRVAGQWRGQFLTITVQGAADAPHAERNEVPL